MAFANEGNTNAAWELALAYLQGYGVKQDLAQADHWFQIGATDQGQKSLVGQLHANGEYFPRSLDLAALWFTAAGRPGDLFELAEDYRTASPPEINQAIPIYLKLLNQTGHPEVRRAKMALGDFVLDGKYSAGEDVHARALNLEWARFIAQESLGQEEYKIAVDYGIGQYDVPKDEGMWLHFCKRAAAYNIDLAQHFYVQAIMSGKAPNQSGYDDVAWTRLASEKRTGEVGLLRAMESGMSPQQLKGANAAYDSLVHTRTNDGAYYPQDDPLRDPSPSALAAMPQDDPDVQLRLAFSMERDAAANAGLYERVISMYRTVRDGREMDIRFVLGRNLLNGTGGIQKNTEVAEGWLHEAARMGSKPAQRLPDSLAGSKSSQ